MGSTIVVSHTYALIAISYQLRGRGAGQRVRGPTLTVKFTQWTTDYECYLWESGGLPPGKFSYFISSERVF